MNMEDGMNSKNILTQDKTLFGLNIHHRDDKPEIMD